MTQEETTNPSQDQLDVLTNLYDTGQMIAAEEACRKLLLNHPQSIVVINILGAVLQSQGKLQEAEDYYRKAIQLDPKVAQVYSNLGNTLKKLDQLDQAVKNYDKAIELKPDFALAYFNRGNVLKTLGQLDQAVKDYNNAIQLKIDFTEAYFNRGNCLHELGQFEKALESYDKAIQLRPDYAAVYNNQGNTLHNLELLERALGSFEKAILLKPDFAEAYSNQAKTLRKMGRLEHALKSCEKAILLKPDLVEGYINFSVSLQNLGRFDEAIKSCQKALSIDPQNDSLWAHFAHMLGQGKLTSYNDELGTFLFKLLDHPSIRPLPISPAVIGWLRHQAIVRSVLELSKSDHIESELPNLTKQLSTVPLLLKLMTLSPIPDLDIERMLTQIRKAMLHQALHGNGNENGEEGLSFYVALAMHCFINEYVFYESEDEKNSIELLQQMVKDNLGNGRTVKLTMIAILGAYRPLYRFAWANDLLKIEWSSDFRSLIQEQVANVVEEKKLQSKIPFLFSIENKVSQLVRNQYEENPYPRWTKAGLSAETRTMRQVLKLSDIKFKEGEFSENPNVLIAGCGTGQHAIEVASRFRKSNVLGIDLSVNSLSYATRKARELGFNNIKFMQADILNLGKLNRQFDLVESIGVLHHMEDPIAAWKVLVDCVKPGCFMKIGLYSRYARMVIVKLREKLKTQEFPNDLSKMLGFRQQIIRTNDEFLSQIFSFGDFYCASNFRDMLFHVQEHQFSLPLIKNCLEELQLNFAGFEHNTEITRLFTLTHPEKNDLFNLDLWDEFERTNTTIFREMYQFWVQKR